MTRDVLCSHFFQFLERSLLQRIRLFLRLYDINEEAIPLASLTHILQSLLWEEVCVFGTGKLIPSALPIFPYYAKLLVTQMVLDYLIQGDTVCLDQVFFWLINRGDSVLDKLLSHLGGSFDEEVLGGLSPVCEVSELSSAVISAASSAQVPFIQGVNELDGLEDLLSQSGNGLMSGLVGQSTGQLVRQSSRQSPMQPTNQSPMQPTQPTNPSQDQSQHIMSLYFTMNLYATIREECFPEESLDDLLSPLLQENATVTKDDLQQALFSFFEVEPDSSRGIVTDIEAFCDLCMTLFYSSEDTNSVNSLQVVTMITLLEFGLTLDESLALHTLLCQLTDHQESPIIPMDRLKCFLSGLARLLVTIPVTDTGVAFSTSTEVMKNTEVMEDQLLAGFLSFGNPEKIKEDALRKSILEDQGNVEGVHVKLAATPLSFLLYCISEQKNTKEIMDNLESILETDHPDEVEVVHSTTQKWVSLLLSLQANPSMALSGESSSLSQEDIAVLRGFSSDYLTASLHGSTASLHNTTASLPCNLSQHVHLFSRDTPMGVFLRVGHSSLLQPST